jgi:hypothetical protein
MVSTATMEKVSCAVAGVSRLRQALTNKGRPIRISSVFFKKVSNVAQKPLIRIDEPPSGAA